MHHNLVRDNYHLKALVNSECFFTIREISSLRKFLVEGMSCAACQARVEKAVSNVDGVTSCSVSLLTNSMGVEGNATDDAIIKAVIDAGYNAYVSGTDSDIRKKSHNYEEDILKDRETPKLKKRLIYSIIFLLILMYVSMGHNMLSLPLPHYFDNNYIALALTQMILALIVMLINSKFFVSGFKSTIHGAPNMDTLVALGSSVSFLWSLYVVYKMCGMVASGDMNLRHIYHNELYFESAAMIPTLITVGKMLEAMSKGKTTSALKSLMKLRPTTAILIKNGVEKEVNIESVRAGDLFKVKPGASIPVDGIIIDGESAIDESAITGESIPVDRKEGDTVKSATINQNSVLICKATHVGEDTTLSKIITMVSDAAATKAPIARIADKVSSIFVPVVIIIAIAVTAIWIMNGADMSFAVERGISVLVISCPCALGLATPVAIMVGSGVGAKNGILFKTSEALETAGRVNTIALDKTGTITKGEPKVTDIYNTKVSSSDVLIDIAYRLEKNSEHPLAKAIVNYVLEKNNSKENIVTNDSNIKDFKILPGNGIVATIDDKLSHAGSSTYISTIVALDDAVNKKIDEYTSEGKTPILFESGGKLLGIIAVADVIKEDSPYAVMALKKLNMNIVLLTGDNERTAENIAKMANIDKVIANVLPDGKEGVIKSLQDGSKVAMVGDGINDAPALTRADVGIAIGAGTDVAIDSADIVLMNNSLADVVNAIRLGKATLKNIYENLFWAFFYNVICIPLAAGVFPYKMNPMIGAAAMSLSSFTVCMNALRLNAFKVNKNEKSK